MSTTTAPSRFATEYLQILGPADAASSKFFSALEKLPPGATGADAQRIATPAADAIELADARLRRVAWPSNIAKRVNALVRADARLVIDLRDVGTQKRVTSGAWKKQFEGDVGEVSTAVQVLVADLGTSTSAG